MKAVVFGQGPRAGLSEYLSDVREQGLLQRYWMVWLPAQCVTFGLVPEHLRIAFVAAISFFWLMILTPPRPPGLARAAGRAPPLAPPRRIRQRPSENLSEPRRI
ncbi:unnamed protein product [Prorocentrum cordatum]|uniref:Uncharacterized protein n=1 Tax=Prorocentrum cordatum TaxID=2364126 RepID=A0ABN9XE33_9DINO|nr:unnamed protein product [Polarella glacialis]